MDSGGDWVLAIKWKSNYIFSAFFFVFCMYHQVKSSTWTRRRYECVLSETAKAHHISHHLSIQAGAMQHCPSRGVLLVTWHRNCDTGTFLLCFQLVLMFILFNLFLLFNLDQMEDWVTKWFIEFNQKIATGSDSVLLLNHFPVQL